MFETIHATTHKISAKIPQSSAAILVLALLSGYVTVAAAAAKIEPPAAPPAPAVCKSDTDTFCVEGDKDKGARLNRQGLEYTAKQDYDQALGLFKRAIATDNSNPEYHYNLGVTYSHMGMMQEEEESYMDVLAIEPNDPKLNRALTNTYFNLACLYALQGKKDQAFVQLEKLFSIDRENMYHDVVGDKDLASLRDDPRYTELLKKKPEKSSESEEAGKPEEASKPASPKKTAKPKKPAKPKAPAKSDVPAK